MPQKLSATTSHCTHYSCVSHNNGLFWPAARKLAANWLALPEALPTFCYQHYDTQISVVGCWLSESAFLQQQNILTSLQCCICVRGAPGGAVGWGTALQAGRSRVRFPMVSLEFFIDIILLAALWPLTEMSTRSISWGVKAAGA